MVRSLLLTFALLLGAAGWSLAQTVLQGTVVDDKGEPIISASIKVLKGTDMVRGTQTDFDGKYRLNLDPGSYDVEVIYSGFPTSRTEGVQVLTNQLNELNVTMSSTVLETVVISAYKVPLIEQDKTSGGQTLTSEQIKNLPTRSVNAIVATTAGTSSIDGGAVNIKGSRSNATNYYIDGIRVGGSPPPVQDIEQLQVITGGLGAEYGDVTGGVISVITKGPASSYHGSVEVENSYGLDAFGWLLATANVSGPIVKRKKADGGKETMIGFRLSGQLLDQKDDDPPALPIHHIKDDVLARLQTHPLIRENGVIISAAENLTRDSVDAFNYRPNEASRNLDLTGKLDFRLTSNIDISLTGTYKDSENKFTPTNWAVLNSQNNPTQYDSRYRGIFRFRHRLGSSEPGKDAASANRVSISNANYQLQFGFERGNSTVYDPRHKDNLFDYGYIGRFDFDWVPIPGAAPDGSIKHVDYREQFNGFQPGYQDSDDSNNPNKYVPNPGLVAFDEFATTGLYSSYVNQNGRFSGVYDDIWSGMHTNVNQVYNRYSKSEDDILTITATSGFDLKLGRSGVHSIQFGLLNEQRTNRNWAVAPIGLWDLMSQKANSHFNGLDSTRVVDSLAIPPFGKIPVFANATVDLPENKFYKEVREALGLPIDQYVNVHEYRPDQFNLGMFSPLELANQQLIDYYGYTYTGEKTAEGITFNDFFKHRDADGVRDFPVAPLNPLYQAAFIKDKFTFNRMIFSLGLRVERFDLNSKVLRDPYSLYEVIGAREFHSTQNAPAKPANIGDDFKVYTTGDQNNEVKAYRNGDTWYTADGTQANDGNFIFGGGVIYPFLRDTAGNDDILDERFDPNTAFADYDPQVNWLPRLAFSFPISDDANFFAHYDVLVQRPPSNWQVTPLDYVYFYTAGRTPGNNANLRPERVVDYEVGFQQKLNNNSSLKLSAYYRELRDMIQTRTILYVPVIGQYNTYGNLDFGTVKGFTAQYDLRRIQNTEVRLAYTLQFADGTGSDANSQSGLTTRGNIRTLFPLNFDERHNIQGIIDYRFSEGNTYNGPRIGGMDILSNFGVNLQFNAVSGRPYTAKYRSVRFGGEGTAGAINGNRLPWRYNLDLRVDKSFNLVAGRNPLNLNVYLRVANLLNKKNVLSVYSATGSPIDDGYLATAEGQSIVQGVVDQGRDANAFLDAYSWALLNANNYSLPRRIYVGLALEF